jgi:hypothetical protein
VSPEAVVTGGRTCIQGQHSIDAASCRYQSVNDDGTATVLITRDRVAPKWSSGHDILNTGHELFVIFYDAASQLLFINSSRSSEGLYKVMADSVVPTARLLATGEVGRVVRGVANKRIFNVGMRNILATTTADSYKILAGSDTQGGITAADGRKYRQGHVFLTGDENGDRTTIGYSSGSKVWSAASHQIPELLAWCRALGQKIRNVGPLVTNSALDRLAPGKVVDRIPPHITWAQWNKDAFDLNPPVQIEYRKNDGTIHRGHILDLDLDVDRANTTAAHIRLSIQADGLALSLEFSLEDFYYPVNGADPERVRVIRGGTNDSLLDYLNEAYLDFYTSANGLLTGNEFFEPRELGPPIDATQIEASAWNGVDIEAEITATAQGRSVHEEIRQRLERGAAPIILFDHGTGEIPDFVTPIENGGAVEIGMYHCKGSGEPRAGARVDDIYEVCGQAQKGVAVASLDRFSKRIQQRRGRTRFVRGTANDLDALLTRAKSTVVQFEIAIVQPGISKAALSQGMQEALGATNTHLIGSGVAPLRVLTSL